MTTKFPVLTMLFLTASCGVLNKDDDSNPPANKNPTPQPTPGPSGNQTPGNADLVGDGLAGVWTSDCKPELTSGRSNAALKFGGDVRVGTAVTSIFSDSACATATMRFEQQFNYEILGPSIKGDGAKRIKTSAKETQLTVIAAQAADAFNDQKFCGYTDWKVGEARILTNSADCLMSVGEEQNIESTVMVRDGVLSTFEKDDAIEPKFVGKKSK